MLFFVRQQWKSNVSNFLSIISDYIERLHRQYVTCPLFAIVNPINLTGFSPPLCIVSFAVWKEEEESGGRIITIAFCGFVVSQKSKQRHKKQIRGESEKFFITSRKNSCNKVCSQWKRDEISRKSEILLSPWNCPPPSKATLEVRGDPKDEEKNVKKFFYVESFPDDLKGISTSLLSGLAPSGNESGDYL